MSGPRVMLASPIYGDVTYDFMACLMRAQESPPCSLVVHCHAGDSLVSRARNNIAAKFLESDCTHLMMVDSDIVFSPEHISKLLSRDRDIIGGLYPKKMKTLAWVCNVLPEVGPEDDGTQRVKYIGTGSMLVKRRVFERMIEAYGPQIAYSPDAGEEGGTKHDFFPVGVYRTPDGHGRYLSEDWYFCQRWLDLGGEVWADLTVVHHHIGRAVYPLFDPRRRIGAPSASGGD